MNGTIYTTGIVIASIMKTSMNTTGIIKGRELQTYCRYRRYRRHRPMTIDRDGRLEKWCPGDMITQRWDEACLATRTRYTDLLLTSSGFTTIKKRSGPARNTRSEWLLPTRNWADQ